MRKGNQEPIKKKIGQQVNRLLNNNMSLIMDDQSS